MRRQTSPVSVFSIVVVLILAALFVARRIQAPTQTPAHRSARTATPEMKRFYPEKRRSRPREERSQREPSVRQGETGQTEKFTCTSDYFRRWREPADGVCSSSFHNGFSIPDPRCTPGGINPSVTSADLSDPTWITRSIRN